MSDNERLIHPLFDEAARRAMEQRVTDYVNFSSRGALAKKRLQEAGFEVVGLPKYPFPLISLASPVPFNGKELLQNLLLDVVNDKLVEVEETPPSYIDIDFTYPFSHPDGTFRSGFIWAINRPEEDTLEMLGLELAKKNPLKLLCLAWGENPYNLPGEVCDAAVRVLDLEAEVESFGLDGVDTIGSLNNSHELAAKITKLGVANWLEWAHIYPRNDPTLFAVLAFELVKRVKELNQPLAAKIYIEDFWEDTYDKEAGEIFMLDHLESLGVNGLVELAKEIPQRYKEQRSHVYD